MNAACLKRFFKVSVAACLFPLVLSSCAGHVDDGSSKQARLQALSCIAVMPATVLGEEDVKLSPEQAASLQSGATFVTGVMTREFAGNPKARILNAEQVVSLVPDVNGGTYGMVSTIAKKVGCDGVLVTTVRRFKQREGTEYASDDPASANLHFSLIHGESKAILWAADFKETQEAFLDNILTYEKMQSRGFRWITVEEMVEQGVKDRLSDCPYLK